MKEKKELDIVFMGTPEFAVTILEQLIKEGYNIRAVVTAPDRPAGRGRKLKGSAVKECATEHGIKVLQPTNLKDEDFVSELKAINADLFIVVAFRMLPKLIWEIPTLGTFNLHGSLLPQYRGAAPINWAIINGEKETGVTTRSEEHTSELQSRPHLVCRLLLEKKKHKKHKTYKHNHRVRISINASNALTTTKHDIISTSDAGL